MLLGRGKYGGFQPLSHDKLNSLTSKLSNLALSIIDEVSMWVPICYSKSIRDCNKSKQCAFGGVSIVAVGDLYQIPI